MPLLEHIERAVRARVAAEKIRMPLDLSTLPAHEPHDLASVLTGHPISVIAEVKRASPTAGSIAPSADIAAVAEAYLDAGAAAVSILTEPKFFGGDAAALATLRTRRDDAVILMKDFVLDPYQVARARQDGADAILLIVGMLGERLCSELHTLAAAHNLSTVVEVHDESEMEIAARVGARIIGVNNRDLRTMLVTLNTSRRLAPLAPRGAVLVSESGISSGAQIAELRDLGYRGFLVGTSLMRQSDPAAALKFLLSETACV